jgi:hypothetical protein
VRALRRRIVRAASSLTSQVTDLTLSLQLRRDKAISSLSSRATELDDSNRSLQVETTLLREQVFSRLFLLTVEIAAAKANLGESNATSASLKEHLRLNEIELETMRGPAPSPNVFYIQEEMEALHASLMHYKMANEKKQKPTSLCEQLTTEEQHFLQKNV